MTTSIQIYSDVICPWCLIGKRRLERALDMSGLRDAVDVSWLPFQLNPDMPVGGMPRAAYREAKFGHERAAELDRQMSELGRAEGIAFAFDRMPVTPNTRAAHALIAFAHALRVGGAVKEALLRAYFEEGRDVGDRETLVEIAASVGIDRGEAALALSDTALAEEVERLEREGRRLGIQGVPFFVVDGRWAVSGAQPTEQWLAFLRDNVPAARDRSAA